MVDKMVKIECLLCGGAVKIPANTDTEQYDGHGVCKKCKSLIHVKLAKGKLQKYKIIKKEFPQREPINIKYVETVKDYGEGQQPQTRTSKQ